jgi:hypothetical protein
VRVLLYLPLFYFLYQLARIELIAATEDAALHVAIETALLNSQPLLADGLIQKRRADCSSQSSARKVALFWVAVSLLPIAATLIHWNFF